MGVQERSVAPAVDVLITGDEAFEQLAGIWQELWERTDPPPPMLEPRWVQNWWQLHRGEGQLCVLLALDETRTPVGLAPLYIRTQGLDPRGWLRTVYFLGTGEDETDEVVGEYNTWLGAREAFPLVSERVAAHLLEGSLAWDRLRLERLSRSARIHQDLPAQLVPALYAMESEIVPTFRSPALPLDQYLSALPSANFRHRCRRALKAAAELGVEFVEAQTAADRAAMFEALRDLHQRRWEDRGAPGAFASEVFSRFHEQLLYSQSRAHRIWITALRHGQRYLAVRYHLRAGDRVYDYLSGVDMSLPTALAPGLLLHLHTIDACARAGIKVYDFMAGDYEYKRRLALERDELVTLDLFARSARARLWLAARDLRRLMPRGQAEQEDDAPAFQ